jgi:hypothetical protein
MLRKELEELHYIVPMENLPSICQHGLLSNVRAEKMVHRSIALEEVQRRRKKQVPGGRRLHEYVNLYICARNPMLFRRLNEREHICVVRVSTNVLELPGVIVTDQNAASDYVRFAPAPQGLKYIDKDATFAEWWTHPDDQIAEWRHKSQKCAEVLVPDCVPPQYLLGVYVSCQRSLHHYQSCGSTLSAAINCHMFFNVT